MKRLLLNFFLVLCVFQLFGSSTLNARPVEDNHISSPQYLSANDHFHIDLSILSIARTDNSSPRRVVCLLTENVEEEEYEVASAKKHTESSHYFSTFFYAYSSGFLFRNDENNLVSCKHPFVIKENGRHILFQVFRI